MTWTSPDDLASQLQRLWDQGRLLACLVPAGKAQGTADDARLQFPLSLKVRRPTARDLGERFGAVRAWVDALELGSRSRLGAGYEIVWDEINNRQLGRNKVPAAILVPTFADALSLIERSEDAARFEALVAETLAKFPTLHGWLARKPLAVLAHAGDWSRMLDCLAWFRDHPRSGAYLRQIDVTGVDTKFIERHKPLLTDLLDIALPPEAIEPSQSGVKAFEARYGLRAKPPLVRFRILDERRAIAGLTDLTVPAEQLAGFKTDVTRVFIVENEITGLAFPPMPASLVVLGLGHAVSLVAGAQWLSEREVYYWSDLDTHGFAMLDRLRASLPRVRSLLMNRATLLAHRSLWTSEPAPHVAPLDRLTPEESALYADLRYDRLARSVRLEQELISFAWLQRTLSCFV
jgi:hypothetical protein